MNWIKSICILAGVCLSFSPCLTFAEPPSPGPCTEGEETGPHIFYWCINQGYYIAPVQLSWTNKTFFLSNTITPPTLVGPLVTPMTAVKYVYYDCPWNTYLNQTITNTVPPSTNWLRHGFPAKAKTVGTNMYTIQVQAGRWEDCEPYQWISIPVWIVVLNEVDSDDSGLPDSWEIVNFGTTGQDPNADPDHDGLTNLQEYQLSTNPNVVDTDGDGVNDGQELIDGTDPKNPDSMKGLLGRWHFDTTNWLGSQGQIPSFTNDLAIASGVRSNAVKMTSPTSGLRYQVVENNGHTNLNLQTGTIRFWFRPQWSSTALGGEPQEWPALLETKWLNGFWGLYLDSTGGEIWFDSSDDAGINWSEGSMAPYLWTSNEWHQITFTYSAINRALYVDGVSLPLMQGSSGITYFPTATEFTIGNDDWLDIANGSFDELEIFDYPLSASRIAADYRSATNEVNRIAIVAQPRNQTVMIGSNVTFTVTAISDLPLSYQWFLGTNSLVGQTGTNLSLTVQATNYGPYRVLVSNMHNSMFSSTAWLHLYGDTDTNGLADDWEMQYFGHLGANPNENPAGDGLSNTLKSQLGLIPFEFISDPTLLKIYTPLK